MAAFLFDTSLIVWLQQFSPTLDLPFKFITSLGNEPFFFLFLPLVYWCIHRRIGAGLAILFLISASVNAIAKAAFGMPRPFMVDSSVLQLAAAGGNGFPSGHTQGAMVVWSYLAVRFQKIWLWWLAGALILLIPLSRLYLGVHFPADLAGGYVIGGLLVLCFYKTERPVAEMIGRYSPGIWILVHSAATVVAVFGVKDQGPYVISPVAALMGTSLGIFLEHRWIGFQINAGLARRSARYLAGVGGLLVFYIGLKTVFSGMEPAWLFRFVRYYLVGLWIAAGAPLVFNRFITQQKPIQ
ncbi:phosphatase PAP2 family protein [uncultured Desulfosarcina sp.]|uniref:phosphatase PAP2 family protein n=1 Tax=uncultured Desulfosarcina sp. TaxID=218289 RepID=UPI0029C72C90|nr:phosphatase PAP2 family protein [uncultured Desulfosarcina sp.]